MICLPFPEKKKQKNPRINYFPKNPKTEKENPNNRNEQLV